MIKQAYSVGGPRQPVYDLMRGLGFEQTCNWSDKVWHRGTVQVNIYGAGSMARVTGHMAFPSEVQLAELGRFLKECGL